MKKKLFVFVLVVMVLSVSAPLFARESIIDNAGLLDAAEKARLEKLIEEIDSAYNFELLILTVKSLDGKDATDYSWDYLDSKGLDGYSWDGCLLLRSMGNREYDLTASGRGDKILNSTAYDKLENDVIAHLRNDDYVRAFETYISTWESYLILESKGRSYNFFTHNQLILILVSWIISLVIGLIVVRFWKVQMNTALPKSEADAYTIPGSLVITKQHDRFLYSTTVKTEKASSSSFSSSGSSSRSGGGRSSRSGRA